MDRKRAIFELRFGFPEISEAELLGKNEILQKWGLYGLKFPLDAGRPSQSIEDPSGHYFKISFNGITFNLQIS